MAENKLRIFVGQKTTFEKWLRTVAFIILAVAIPVGIGIYAGSSAMQWVGFAFGCLAVLSFAIGESNRTTFDTYDAAIAFLQKEKGSSKL